MSQILDPVDFRDFGLADHAETLDMVGNNVRQRGSKSAGILPGTRMEPSGIATRSVPFADSLVAAKIISSGQTKTFAFCCFSSSLDTRVHSPLFSTVFRGLSKTFGMRALVVEDAEDSSFP